MGKETIKYKRGELILTNKLGKFERLNQEEMKILINQTVQGLAPVNMTEKRRHVILQVNQLNWTPLASYMKNTMNVQTALTFIWSTLRIAFDCERYGLRVDNLCWDANKVFVDPQGNVCMVYWPVTTLEQAKSNALAFYFSFYGILYGAGADAEILGRYYSYFYQRDYFDFPVFYQMIQVILDQWRRSQYREKREENARRKQEQLKALRPDSRYVVASGWLEKPGSSEKISLAQEEIIVGRDSTQCAVVVTDCDGVSRRHAVIKNRENQYFLADLDSKNGTFVDGVRLKPKERVLLNDGATIRFGSATYIFHKTNLNQTISIHHMRRQKA